MIKVYKITGFPDQLGVIVKSSDDPQKTISIVLIREASERITSQNILEKVEKGVISLIAEYPETDEGWIEAMELRDAIASQ